MLPFTRAQFVHPTGVLRRRTLNAINRVTDALMAGLSVGFKRDISTIHMYSLLASGIEGNGTLTITTPDVLYVPLPVFNRDILTAVSLEIKQSDSLQLTLTLQKRANETIVDVSTLYRSPENGTQMTLHLRAGEGLPDTGFPVADERWRLKVEALDAAAFTTFLVYGASVTTSNRGQ